MTQILTGAQMRAEERAAIDSGACTGLELMERAGGAVVDAILARWPALSQCPHRALILCGAGNNGGDGFVVARLLKGLGWKVDVGLFGAADRLPPDARANFDRWSGPVFAIPEAGGRRDTAGYDLILDALFGIGLSRPLAAEAALAGYLPDRADPRGSGGPRVVAVDVPSGLCGDSGRMLGKTGLWADLTVTFHRPKPGHFLDRGPWLCGQVVCADIGLDNRRGAAPCAVPGQADSAVPVARLIGPPAPAALSKQGDSTRGRHKFDHGHALVLAGGVGRGGAARLAARGALRIGAGLVTLGVPPAALIENAARLDAVMLRRIDDDAAFSEVLTDRRINALCLGPGLGQDRAQTLVPVALADADPARAAVLDADALSAFSDDPQRLFHLIGAMPVVLTPHGGEFARLFPDLSDLLSGEATQGPAWSRLDAVRAAAARSGAVVLLKGADTVIAAPDGRSAVHAAVGDLAAPWLATAGAGDVLAGMITGLLARGHTPFDAACTACWLHAACARDVGPGLIAEDLPEALRAVFRSLAVQ